MARVFYSQGPLVNRPLIQFTALGDEYGDEDTGDCYKALPVAGGGRQWAKIYPQGGGGGGSNEFTNIFAKGGPCTLNDWVYVIPGSGSVALADASDPNKGPAVGVVVTDLGASAEVLILGKWTGGSGLTPGDTYYVHPALPGKITNVAPTTIGQYVQRVGYAQSSSILIVQLDRDYEIL